MALCGLRCILLVALFHASPFPLFIPVPCSESRSKDTEFSCIAVERKAERKCSASEGYVNWPLVTVTLTWRGSLRIVTIDLPWDQTKRGCVVGWRVVVVVAASSIYKSRRRWGGSNHLWIMAITWPSTFSSISIDSLLQFILRAQMFLFTLVLIEVLHVSVMENRIGRISGREGTIICWSIRPFPSSPLFNHLFSAQTGNYWSVGQLQ